MLDFFNRLSFTRKLVVVNIFVILPVLIIGTIVSIYFIANNERTELREQIGAISTLTASYSIADLLFDDNNALSKTLQNLDVFPSIEHAYVINNDEEVIASYGSHNEENKDKIKSGLKTEFLDNVFYHYNPINYKGNDLGTLIIISNTEGLQRALRNLSIAIVIGSLFSFLVLVGMSVRLQRVITKPILNLVDIIAKVTKTENYNTRITETGNKDEIDVLYSGFNKMMNAIGETTVSKNYLDNILDSLAEMLIVVDENENIVSTNDAVVKTTEYEEVELLSHDVYDLIGEEVRGKLNDGELIEHIIYTQSEQEIYTAISITSFINRYGEKRKILSIRDVSKQKEAERAMNEYYEKLDATNRELEKLSYITSHDLKAPLRAIGSLIMMLKEDLEEGVATQEEIDEYFMLMRKRTKRMDSLINGILEYSRVGRKSIEIKPVDLEDLMDEITGTVVPKDFGLIKTPDFPTVNFNPIQIYQLFQNLISNAIKYNDKEKGKGKLEVLWKDMGKKYRFIIRDNGPGIDPKYHEKVFEVFQVLTARDQIESTGIGLSIVKKIIEQAKGKIWIESAVGKGTAFIFELPK